MTPQQRTTFSIRLAALTVAGAGVIGLLSVRLFVLQISQGGYWRDLAESQHVLAQELLPKRGEVYIQDRDSPNPTLAIANVNRPTLYVVPQEVQDAKGLATKLASQLQLDRNEIQKKIEDQSRKYVPLVRVLPSEEADRLKAQKLPGVHLEDQFTRAYPEGELAAQVLGFFGFDGDERSGRYGIEKFFDKDLTGTPGSVEGTQDHRGDITTSGQRRVIPAQDGISLVLTLDRAIQFKAEEVLKRTVQQYEAKGGSVVVISPKTGAILAMANYPTFDPNTYGSASDVSVFNNNTVSEPFEPGSIMKPMTMAGGLEEGVITPDTKFTDPGSVTLENFTIRNSQNKTYGEVTMTQVLEESINTGAIFAEQQLGHEKFGKYIEAFGFGSLTGIELPFESKGNISNLSRGGSLYAATISYGQGFTATPLQLVAAYAAIAAGGEYHEPYIVEERRISSGAIEKTKPQVVRRVISEHAAATLAAMLVSVVERGHGKRAEVPGYFIAGKTGTAQVAYENRIGYDPAKTIGSFAGFGPVEDPVFAMIVKIDQPKDVRFAEVTAAPAFGEIAQFILNYYQVPHSR
ncbi:MAG TPA: penicillin-binding protein 2 [Patescibacteria group bacterium]|nr:penicillin-binding protein 2 [Patescibacteria group bacterium]